ncbi:bifunctional 2-C-methyl-D-erythritol 4-phosphate cytidylyltransferase/2-C-methyl-D-erythritol 2,4-cyclodiphosphate synthase [Hyphomonas sp. WL0036]|uniref:bifunctional 2-C-methyl-D-erythritol 4-phosphate cytidylyltransferase/2-C-methyl-D-erythritol 2,4-cyclodiphosphate synthase n=1 Tax=Hyphomonas sediminis TaxID=2866160 RepID=UPI001C80BDBD|nr:bifunctional 2-C-methyl-D-erythritol 4-phosphate cytidylyltransferase/2-C-methyl-D-erythritol 2,4-cyclodiphosphate synthase [Hyphomonas sediminis]MBY9067836.1 bifunctional 2-C-methyl-D-erythritol 4-phosphate cytidylyltransferase/2-C-methyl-D-erythritol 2,4-cyclodiphosphate synthase [Hyphomonas sediminis]
MTEAVAIIVAGGTGQRAGAERPKQWQMLLGKRVIDWSIDAFCTHPRISQVVVVAGPELGALPEGAPIVQANPGATRTQSVLSGLAAATLADDAVVLIHDAARPGIDAATISALIETLSDKAVAASAPAMPVADALKSNQGQNWTNVDRTGLFRVQTPQAFRLGEIRAALSAAGPDLVDDLAAIEAAGGAIRMVPGSARLSKITYAEDFDMLARLLSPAGTPRIGKGYDVHEFEAGDHVTLCGVAIPHIAKLKGHSDADAAWHALTDAILGAVALGDIGDHFPPSDPKWKGADSGIFLKEAQRLAEAKGYVIANCDITVICEAPKVKPHREAMRERTAELLGLPLDAVSVKATTTEGLGFTGRREGIAAEAVALLVPKG